MFIGRYCDRLNPGTLTLDSNKASIRLHSSEKPYLSSPSGFQATYTAEGNHNHSIIINCHLFPEDFYSIPSGHLIRNYPPDRFCSTLLHISNHLNLVVLCRKNPRFRQYNYLKLLFMCNRDSYGIDFAQFKLPVIHNTYCLLVCLSSVVEIEMISNLIYRWA